VDYVSSLEGLKKLGEWLLDVHSFVAEKYLLMIREIYESFFLLRT
jgi:hypothetical protein